MKKYILGLILYICVLIIPVFAVETSIIIQSPLYTSSVISDGFTNIDRSFKGQLGFDDETAIKNNELTNEEKIVSAISQPNYPVTPGDQLRIVYTDAKQTVSALIQVNTSYSIELSPFGEIDGNEKSFEQFRHDIIEVIKTYLPFSNPQVTLVNVGSFYVTVKGEVKRTMQIPSWGLSRLSTVIDNASDYASTRKIIVTSLDNSSKSYDMYAALREGELDQDPLLKTGDIVTLLPSDTTITVVGEVKREGTYQVIDSKVLVDVIKNYAKGILPSGDDKNFTIRRYDKNNQIQIISVDSPTASSFVLQDFDTVFVNPVIPETKAVSVEGAINIGSGTTTSTNVLSSSGKLYYQFYPGESVNQMLQNISSRFTTVSDLSNMYVKRNDTIIPVNAKNIFIGESKETKPLILQEGDSFVVPFNQLFVHVAGGVLKPGTYPYVPDKDASYYINIAGGFDPSKNRNGSFSVIDKEGNRLDKDAIVPTESIVTAKLNTFQAVNGMNLSTTIAITGLVASILAIISGVIELSQ